MSSEDWVGSWHDYKFKIGDTWRATHASLASDSNVIIDSPLGVAFSKIFALRFCFWWSHFLKYSCFSCLYKCSLVAPKSWRTEGSSHSRLPFSWENITLFLIDSHFGTHRLSHLSLSNKIKWDSLFSIIPISFKKRGWNIASNVTVPMCERLRAWSDYTIY